MNLGFGLLITLIGVVSVFSSLAVIALACVALKRIFEREMIGEVEVPLTKETGQKGVGDTGARAFRIRLNGEEHEVKIVDLGTVGKEFEEVKSSFEIGEELKVIVGGEEYRVKVERFEGGEVKPPLEVKEDVTVSKEAVKEKIEVITAPMQGTVVKVAVKVGSKVEKGSTVIVLETMKMENAIESTVSGIVKEINVSEGDSVKDGDILVSIG